jgi:hypothetical protein
MWFIYFWDINPDESRLQGPYESEEVATEIANEDDSGDNAGVMLLPFTQVK